MNIMAEQKILQSDYAPFGQIIDRTAERPDNPAQWHPRKISEREILKRYGWTEDDLQAALSDGGGKYNFPRPIHSGLKLSSPATLDFWRLKRRREWSEPQVLTWETDIRELAARLPKRV